MEPPLKRPRLSMFSNNLPPDENFSRARWRNDLSLKSRFEAIFEKYAHDFTGIGDEIEVATGTVIVNNGHLEAMEDEKDTGAAMPPHRTLLNRPGNINGSSLLRAMTVAPEDQGLSFEDVYDSDLVMSIEAMAESAAEYSDDGNVESTSAEDSTDKGYNWDIPVVASYGNFEVQDSSSDEELFQTAGARSTEHLNGEAAAFLRTHDTDSAEDLIHNNEDAKQIPLSNNNDLDIAVKQEEDKDWQDKDSLFGDRGKDRFSTPDSLFEVERDLSGLQNQQMERESCEPAYPELPNISREVSDDAIIDKFGPRIGSQVIDVLQKRRAMMDAHIEPAWRVPDIGIVFPKPKLETPPDDLRLSPELNSGKKDSLWQDSQGSRPALQELGYEVDRRVRESSQFSNESVDPLQEEFHPSKEVDAIPNDENLEISLGDVYDGICPFCRKQFSVRGSVYVHWDELIKKSVQDNVHDMKYIRCQRRRKRHRSQFPKVTVEDFYTIIKLREVDKLDWQEIHDQGFFGRRPSTSLQSIYYQYRTLAKTDEELAEERRSWTAEEDTRLLGFCEDSTITFQKLRKLMGTRPQAEIGNRLATIWIQQGAGQAAELLSPGIKVNPCFKITESNILSCLEPGQVRRNGLELDYLRRSWSSDSMNSLFQVDCDARGNSDHSDSDNDLFGAVQHRV